MSFWNEDHPMQWMHDQVAAALPLFGPSNNKKYSDSTNEDLTEAANLLCLAHDFYNNGSLAANIEARLSRYKEECKYGKQMFQLIIKLLDIVRLDYRKRYAPHI